MDSKRACDLVEEVFLTIKNAKWIPQYNFDFANLWHLTHRGMSMEQVKDFLKSFNNALREKLMEPSRQEASYEVLAQIHETCSSSQSNTEKMAVKENTVIKDAVAEFDFL